LKRPHEIVNPPRPERALLVGHAGRDGRGFPGSFEELALLADTAGARVLGSLVQRRGPIHPATFIGKGKLEELAELARDRDADLVIFNDDLSAPQIRNLEQELAVKVVDRSELILDIFARRARTREARLQVELAQLEYTLPRLTGMWKHLERQAGGIGTRGPGETQLEVDRRRVRTRIGQLHRRLRDVERTRGLHRHERAAVPFPTVALVGYTNSGKSTLMNRLTQAGVLVEDRLFATLDPTVRRLRLPEGLTVLLADTVGFIHKLPHQLVEAFKGTLEEVREADLLLHVIDVAQSTWPEQAQVVEAVLEEIGAGDRPAIRVFNKTDLPAAGSPPPASGPDAVSISARTGKDVGALLAAIEARLTVGLERVRCALPSGRGDVLAWLRRVGRVVEEYYRDGVVMVTALVPPKVAGQLRKRLPETAAPPC